MPVTQEKISQLPITSNKIGAYFYLIVPDGFGGWLSKQISTTDLLAGASDSAVKILNQTGNIVSILASDTWIDSIVFEKVTGSPIVKVGTSANGNNIIDSISIVDMTICELNLEFAASQTIYFTITGGAINIRENIKLNYIN